MIDKLLPVCNVASSRSKENVNLKHFQHLKVSVLECHTILFWTLLFGVFGRCYCQCLFSLILFGRCYCHSLFLWQMFYVMFD